MAIRQHRKLTPAGPTRTGDKSKDKEKAEKERIIARWMRENKKFVRLLDRVAFEIHVGKWGCEDKVDAKFVKDLLEENGYTDLPFSAGDLLRYWDKGPVYTPPIDSVDEIG